MEIDRPITIIITLFIILLLVFFLVLPEYNAFGQLRTELGEKTAEYNAEYVYYEEIAKTEATLQSDKDDLKIIDDALPQDSDLGAIVSFLQGTAKQNSLVVKDLFLSKSSPNIPGNNASSNIKDTTFSIDVLGNYPSLEGFIVALEKSSRIFEVSSISFGSVPGSPIQNFSLQIKTYSYQTWQ